MDPMVRGAADAYRTPQPIIEEFTYKNERVNHYVWYPGEDLPWPEIKDGFIKRCRVAPIVAFETWERINDVPEDMRLAVRRDWMDRTHQEAKYEIRPQGIFNSVMENYGVCGLRELTALTGMEPEKVAALNIDAIFCPWPEDCPVDEMPKSYQVIEDHIRRQLGTLNGNRILRSVGEDMLKSITASRAYDETLVDAEESKKELKYTNPGLRALSRLDRRRRDAAQNDMAAAQNKVFDKIPEILAAQAPSDNSAFFAALLEQNKLMREELAMNREAITTLLAERKAGRPPKQADA